MSFYVEHLSPSDSPIARFDPRWRPVALAVAGVSVAVLSSPLGLAAGLAFSLLLAIVARVPARWYRARIGLLVFALAPFLVLLPLTVDRGGPSFELFGLNLFRDGLIAAIALMCKTIAIVTLMMVLFASAPLHVTLRAAQRLGAPGLFVQLAMMSCRYVFLILDELNRLRISLRVRGFRNRANRHCYRTIGRVTGTLLVRGADRAERVAQAMRCRGFDGKFHGLDEYRTTWRDVAMFAAIVAMYAGLVVWEFAGSPEARG